MKENKKFKVALGKFNATLRTYILMEYRDMYYNIYNSIKISREVRFLASRYYLGGNTIPSTAGQIIDYVRSKYTFDE